MNSQFYTFNFGKNYKDVNNYEDKREVRSYKNVVF